MLGQRHDISHFLFLPFAFQVVLIMLSESSQISISSTLGSWTGNHANSELHDTVSDENSLPETILKYSMASYVKGKNRSFCSDIVTQCIATSATFASTSKEMRSSTLLVDSLREPI